MISHPHIIQEAEELTELKLHLTIHLKVTTLLTNFSHYTQYTKSHTNLYSDTFQCTAMPSSGSLFYCTFFISFTG